MLEKRTSQVAACMASDGGAAGEVVIQFLVEKNARARLMKVSEQPVPRLRVTSRRMFIGDQVFELADVKSLKYVGIGVGLAVMLAPFLFSPSLFSSDTSPLFIGLGVGSGLALLSLIPLFIGLVNSAQAQADRVSAFQTYPRSLQRRLALDEEAAPAREKPAPSEVDRRTDVPLRVSLF